MRRGTELTRYVAPAALLAAVTVAVLLLRAALDGDSERTSRAALARADGARVPPARKASRPKRSERPRRYYVLRRGDTLVDVAALFGTTVERLLLLNPGIDPGALRVGQRLRVS